MKRITIDIPTALATSLFCIALIGCGGRSQQAASQSDAEGLHPERRPRTANSQSSNEAGETRGEHDRPASPKSDIAAQQPEGIAGAPSVEASEQSADLTPADLQVRAMRALESGDHDSAYVLCRQAMRLTPEDPSVVFAMARVLAHRHRFPEAIRMLDTLAESVPDLQLTVLGQTAEWMVRYGQYEDAEARYRRLLDRVPEAVLVHRNLAQLLLRQGRRFEASEHLAFLCRAGDVTEEELRVLLRLAFPFRGDAVRETFEPIGNYGRAVAAAGKGSWREARRELCELAEPGDRASGLLARVTSQLEDHEAAESALGRIGSQEKGGHAWFSAGLLAAQSGQTPQAVRCLAESILRDPTCVAAYRRFSENLEQLGRVEASRSAQRRAQWLDETHSLGREMAANSARDGQSLNVLIERLEQLHRPLEALAWRGLQIAYAQQVGALSETQARNRLVELNSRRAELLKSGTAQAMPGVLLCGIELREFPLPTAAKRPGA